MSALHNRCMEVVGREYAQLPVRFYLTPSLIAPRWHVLCGGRRRVCIFRCHRVGVWALPWCLLAGEMALFLLVINDSLSARSQVALCARAVGHLLLNYSESLTGSRVKPRSRWRNDARGQAGGPALCGDAQQLQKGGPRGSGDFSLASGAGRAACGEWSGGEQLAALPGIPKLVE